MNPLIVFVHQSTQTVLEITIAKTNEWLEVVPASDVDSIAYLTGQSERTAKALDLLRDALSDDAGDLTAFTAQMNEAAAWTETPLAKRWQAVRESYRNRQ